MAVEFLDEPKAGGFEFIDQPSGGVEFVGDVSEPVSAAVLNQKFKDLSYTPTLAEFKIWQQAQDERSLPQRAGDFMNTAGEAAGGLWDMLKAGAKGLVDMAKDPEENDPLVTGVEGVARGTRRSAQLVGGIMRHFLDPDQSVKESAQQFLNEKLYEWRGATIGAPGSKPQPSQEQLKQWQDEFEKDVLPGVRYRSFIADRIRKQQEAPPPGKISVITGEEAPISPEFAEAQSLVTDPLALVPMSRALTPAKTITRAIAAKTLQGAGKTFEWVGEKTVQAGTLPERAAGALARAVSGTDEAAAQATQTVASGVAGISTAPVKAAGKTIKAGGEAATAVGRQAAAGPSRYGLFDRISKDANAPQWMRRAASVARPLDHSVSAAGIAAKGATEGAALGTILGAATDGEEGAAAGFGGGLVLGAGGALVGRALAGGKYRVELEKADLLRWMGSKSPEEFQNLYRLNLTHDQAVTLMDVERMARGVGNDVEFRYLSDKDFVKEFGIAKGAQIVEGDRPIVVVNTGYKGPRSAFHEVMHALDALEGSTPQRQKLNRQLFDQTLPDGTIVSRGIYSAEDLAQFTSQYRSRLNEAAKAEFDLLTPEDRQARILSEVRAEAFANLMSGGTLRVGAARGIRQRLADSLLLAEQDSMLGRMRSALESAGVKFKSSGEPSELFVKNGKPITNVPAVDAALRDYIRAKDNITRKLVAGDEESPQFVVRPEDIVRNRALVEAFKDSDLFARNPDGSVKIAVKPEAVARLESAEQKAIAAARDAEAQATAAKQAADDAAAAVAEASARSMEADAVAAMAKTAEAKAEAKAAKVRWGEARKRGEAQLKQARAKEAAARELAKSAAAQSAKAKNAKLAAGVPLLLSEAEINRVQARRVEAMIGALERVPSAGEADVMTQKPNGAWEGRWFSERQLQALLALPDDVLSPGMKAKLQDLNALARVDGQQIILDYNAALKNRRYSSGIAPTTRAVVPLTFNISKAGNFFMTTLDTTHFFRKLGAWRRSRPKAFEAWNGDADAFLRDVFTYLDNHVNGRPGSVNLDSDAAVAVNKKNVINDFFNVPKGKGNEDLNPVQISKPGDKDNLIRSRRFDRINRITPGSGDRFPVRYELQKRNYLPESGMSDDYHMSHRPRSDGPPAHDLLSTDLAPRDIYDRPDFYTGDPGSKGFRESVAALRAIRGKPDANVKVFRAAPKNELNSGDWISLSKSYARQHGLADVEANDIPVHEFMVKARDVKWAGDTLEEFGYFPPDDGGSGKANFLPAGESPETGAAARRGVAPNVSPVAQHKHLLAQAQFDVASKVNGPPNLARWLGESYVEALDKRLSKGNNTTRTSQLERLHALARDITPEEMNSALAAMVSGGHQGAKERIEQLVNFSLLK